MKYIPQHLHASTPIALKATAGLRLLPEAESKAILEHVIKRFKKYPFQTFNDSVQIMGGMDEGEKGGSNVTEIRSRSMTRTD